MTFKRKFLAGLVITVPAMLTIFVFFQFFKFVDSFLDPLYIALLGRHYTGIGFLSAVLLIFVFGLFSTNVLGKKILTAVEKVFLHIPVFKSVYTAIKQLVDAFSPENKSSFKQFVIVEYPRPGVHSFGFLTNECMVSSSDGDRNLKAVYVPTNNLYLGEIVLFDEKSIIFTSIPIDEGIKIILSGGTAAPGCIKGTKGVAT